MAESVTEFAKVARVIKDGHVVVINRGHQHGLNEGQRCLVFEVGEEILDPDTGESLGRLKLIKGEGCVTFVDEKMSHVKSSKKRTRIIYPSRLEAYVHGEKKEEITLPFEHPKEGDFVKIV
ncbi:hypothetical protein ACQZV8_06355 [Magnetococcales bacterium HHB-1]